MNKLLIALIVASLMVPAISSATIVIDEPTPIIDMVIVKQDGFEKLIDINITRENDTLFYIDYSLNPDYISQLQACKTAKCFQDFIDKENLSVNLSQLDKSALTLDRYPVEIILKDNKSQALPEINLLSKGQLKIAFEKAEAGQKVRIGYNTIYTETINTSNAILLRVNILIDSNNFTHILYANYSASDTYIIHCNNTLGYWNCANAFDTGTDVTYPLSYLSAAMDNNSRIHVIYDDSNFNRVKYSNNTNGAWGAPETIDGKIGITGASTPVSIDIDTNNIPHVCYNNMTSSIGASTTMMYANRTAQWNIIPLLKSSYNCDIQADSSNNIHILNRYYASGGAANVTYINLSATGLSMYNITERLGPTAITSLRIGTGGSLHFAISNTTAGFQIRYCNNTNGWNCETVAPIGIVPSLALDQANHAYISFQANYTTDMYITLCNNTIGPWSCTNLSWANPNGSTYMRGRSIALKTGRQADSTAYYDNVSIGWRNYSMGIMYTTINISTYGGGGALPAAGNWYNITTAIDIHGVTNTTRQAHFNRIVSANTKATLDFNMTAAITAAAAAIVSAAASGGGGIGEYFNMTETIQYLNYTIVKLSETQNRTTAIMIALIVVVMIVSANNKKLRKQFKKLKHRTRKSLKQSETT